MNLKTFFLSLFLLSITVCLGTTFFPDIIINILQTVNITENIKFIALVSLIISIFAYIGMLISFYFSRKREKYRLKKLQEDRINIDKIHKELEALR